MRQGFCWLDLKTRETPRTEEALHAALGWRFAVDEEDWRRAVKIHASDGRHVGGVSDLSAPVYPPGTAPHIAYYLAVDDLDARTASATAAGARLLMEPCDIADQGRLAVLTDPCGAGVALWQPGAFSGWADPAGYRMLHVGPEPDAARAFYRAMLGEELTGADFTTPDAPGHTPATASEAVWELVVPGSAAGSDADAEAGTGALAGAGERRCRCLVTPDGPRLHRPVAG